MVIYERKEERKGKKRRLIKSSVQGSTVPW